MPLIKSTYFEDAIGCLKQVKDKYCPLEMVSLIEKTFQLLEDAKKESVGAQLALNADNTIPLVLFLVLRANIQHLGAEIALLEDLLGADFEALMLGYTGYCVTTLKAAYQHILSDKFYQNWPEYDSGAFFLFYGKWYCWFVVLLLIGKFVYYFSAEREQNIDGKKKYKESPVIK